MNSMIGKSTGIALLMAAALLAALFAMGVFSATGVGAHDGATHPHAARLLQLEVREGVVDAGTGTALVLSPTAFVPATTDDPAVAQVQKYQTPTLGKTYTGLTLLIQPEIGTLITGVSPAGWQAYSGDDATADPGDASAPVKADGTATAADETAAENVLPNQALQAAAAFAIAFPVGIGPASIQIEVGDDPSVATVHTEATYTVGLSYDSPATSNTAGSTIELQLEAETGALDSGDDFFIEFGSGIGLPSSISSDDVLISNGDNVNREPASAFLNGRTLRVTVPDMNGDTDGNPGITVQTDADVSVRIRQTAGISNPTEAGLYFINAKTGVGDDQTTVSANVVSVIRSVSIDPKKGSSSADVTVTGKGFSGGSATVFIDKTIDDAATTDVDEESYTPNMEYDDGVDVVIASGATIADGSFTVTIAGISKPEGVDKVTISAFDGGSNRAEKTAEYTFSSGLTVSPESISWGQTLTLTMSDNGETPTEVRFGGNNSYKMAVETGATNKEAKVKVPPGVPVGNQNVEVISSSGVVSGLSTTVEIVPLTLSISPTDPVPGEQVTIRGSGFENSKQITGVTFGSLGEVALTDTSVTSTSSGRVSFTYKVPLDIGTGEKKVTLDVGERIGSGTITVPKPSVSVSPAESLIGSTITVTGSGFASSNRVEVFYDDEIEDVGVADSNGAVNINLTVPASAGIGATNSVEVRVRAEDSIKASADHKTPGAMITVSEQAQAGGMLTISGSNFQSFSILSEVLVGGQNVLPSPAPETDRQGTFEFQVRVPLLSVGSHTVSVKDGDDNSATETFSVVAEVVQVSTAPADVFADLIAADRLERVWYLIGATQMWEFYDPDPELASFNNLDEITVGEAYIVIVSEGDPIEFQGRTLYAGSNNIPIR